MLYPVADDTLLLPKGVNPNALFLVWQHLGGDHKKTAAATGVQVSLIKALAHDYGWSGLVSGRLGLGDEKLEKEINRTHNYVQAQRMRRIIDRAFEFLETEPEALYRALHSVDRVGTVSVTAKPLVELAKAAESVHAMTYRALQDKEAQRLDPNLDDDERTRSLSLTINQLITRAAGNATSGIKNVTDVKEEIGV